MAELAEEFAVTTETVRRDLSALERMGLIRRVHGGAVPASALAVIESGLAERDLANTAAKDADRRPPPSPCSPRPARWSSSTPAPPPLASPPCSPATTG